LFIDFKSERVGYDVAAAGTAFNANVLIRQKGKTGSTYRGLNLASFRGSSELEFSCDSAYLLVPNENGLVHLNVRRTVTGPWPM